MVFNLFAIEAALFLLIGAAWAYFAIKAVREQRWVVASLRGIATAISFGVVAFEFVLAGRLLQ
jgi:hypothetical protein